MKQAKQGILIFLITITVLFIGVISLVVWSDPFFQYHKPLVWFPYVIDNQLSQNPGMARHTEYDSVMLGSSMTVNFEMDWFYELGGQNTRKLSYSGAYPKDQSNIMKQIFASENKVETIYLGLDILPYSGGVDETKYPIPEHLYDDYYWNDMAYVLNKDVLLNYILRPMADPDDKTDLSSVYSSWWTDEYYNRAYVISQYNQPEQVEEELPVDTFLAAVEENMRVNILPFVEENPDTEFVLFFSPYSILFWNSMMRENRLEATIAEYELMSKMVLEHENIRLFFFANIEEIVTDLDNYADYTHFHARINYYMTECFYNGTHEVTAENLQKEIEKLRHMALSYPYEELDIDWEG